MEEWKRGYKPFMHIYAIPPIDLWENALVPSLYAGRAKRWFGV